jgi:hypothetical protein
VKLDVIRVKNGYVVLKGNIGAMWEDSGYYCKDINSVAKFVKNSLLANEEQIRANESRDIVDKSAQKMPIGVTWGIPSPNPGTSVPVDSLQSLQMPEESRLVEAYVTPPVSIRNRR